MDQDANASGTPPPAPAFTPPPLPPPAPPSAPDTSSVWINIATASFLAPILAFGLAALLQPLLKTSPEHALYISLVLSGLLVLFCLVGVVCGIIALAGAAQGRRGLALRGALGLALSSLLLALYVTNFMKGRNQALARQQTARDAKAALQEMHAKARANFDPERGVTNTEAFDVKKMAEVFAKSRNKSDQAVVVFFDRMAKLQKRLAAVSERMQGVELDDYSVAKDPVALRQRNELLQEFISANGELRDFMLNARATLEAELRKQGAPPAAIAKISGEFEKGLNQHGQREVLATACRARIRYGEAVLAVYDWLAKNPGQWTLDQANNEFNFTADAQPEQQEQYEKLGEAWNDSMAVMEKAEAALIEMQRKVFSVK